MKKKLSPRTRKWINTGLLVGTMFTVLYISTNILLKKARDIMYPVKKFDIFTEKLWENYWHSSKDEDFDGDGFPDQRTVAYDLNNNGIPEIYAHFPIVPLPYNLQLVSGTAESVIVDSNEDNYIDYMLFDLNGNGVLETMVEVKYKQQEIRDLYKRREQIEL